MKLFLLANILNYFFSITEPESLESLAKNLPKGETAWVIGKLSNSYENEILASLGLPIYGNSLEGYQQSFGELGLEIEHLEIKREMMIFNTFEELRNWIIPQVKNPVLVEEFILAIQQKGWVPIEEHKIGIPIKQLVISLKAE